MTISGKQRTHERRLSNSRWKFLSLVSSRIQNPSGFNRSGKHPFERGNNKDPAWCPQTLPRSDCGRKTQETYRINSTRWHKETTGLKLHTPQHQIMSW